jgi:glycine reductase
MAKEFERAGIPTTLISTLVPLAQSIGPNRVVAGRAVTNPLGDPSLPPREEFAFRRKLVSKALELLRTELQQAAVVRLDEEAPVPVPRAGSGT